MPITTPPQPSKPLPHPGLSQQRVRAQIRTRESEDWGAGGRARRGHFGDTDLCREYPLTAKKARSPIRKDSPAPSLEAATVRVDRSLPRAAATAASRQHCRRCFPSVSSPGMSIQALLSQEQHEDELIFINRDGHVNPLSASGTSCRPHPRSSATSGSIAGDDRRPNGERHR